MISISAFSPQLLAEIRSNKNCSGCLDSLESRAGWYLNQGTQKIRFQVSCQYGSKISTSNSLHKLFEPYLVGIQFDLGCARLYIRENLMVSNSLRHR